jgi:serine/threonine protein kinase
MQGINKKLKLELLSIGTPPIGAPQSDESVLPSFVERENPFDQYIDIEEVGWGALSSVYQAKSRSDGTFKAIKVVNAGPFETIKIRKALKEAQIGHQIDHPNILQIQQVFYDGTRFFFVMDLVEPLTVSSSLDLSKKSLLQKKEQIVLFQQLVSAVKYLHSKGIFHRDIKVQNCGILLDEDGNPHLVVFDFGEACEKSEHYSDCPGTAIHMAPEVLNSSQYSDRSEMWASISFLVELLTGKPMILHSFSGALGSVSTIHVQLKIDEFREKKEPPIPEVFKTDKSRAGILLLQILRRGLAIDPAERLTFPELEHLLQELIAIL